MRGSKLNRWDVRVRYACLCTYVISPADRFVVHGNTAAVHVSRRQRCPRRILGDDSGIKLGFHAPAYRFGACQDTASELSPGTHHGEGLLGNLSGLAKTVGTPAENVAINCNTARVVPQTRRYLHKLMAFGGLGLPPLVATPAFCRPVGFNGTVVRFSGRDLDEGALGHVADLPFVVLAPALQLAVLLHGTGVKATGANL